MGVAARFTQRNLPQSVWRRISPLHKSPAEGRTQHSPGQSDEGAAPWGHEPRIKITDYRLKIKNCMEPRHSRHLTLLG